MGNLPSTNLKTSGHSILLACKINTNGLISMDVHTHGASQVMTTLHAVTNKQQQKEKQTILYFY